MKKVSIKLEIDGEVAYEDSLEFKDGVALQNGRIVEPERAVAWLARSLMRQSREFNTGPVTDPKTRRRRRRAIKEAQGKAG